MLERSDRITLAAKARTFRPYVAERDLPSPDACARGHAQIMWCTSFNGLIDQMHLSAITDFRKTHLSAIEDTYKKCCAGA